MLRRAFVLIGTIACIGGLALPAHAASTDTTFSLTAGSLSVSVPSSFALGSASTGTATLSGSLGTVAVTDDRGATLGTWSVSVSASDFTTGGATSNETIAKAQVDYWSGAATTTGVAVFLPGQAAAINKQALSAARTAYSASAVVGNNTASWSPTVTLNIPAAAVAGSYTGTITHSLA